MCATNLLEVFRLSVSEFAGDKPDLLFKTFEDAVRAKKYDIQDITIIEAVLKEESESLKESFAAEFVKQAGDGGWGEQKCEKAAAVFLDCLDGFVNYFYSNTIAGQFS